MKSEFKALLRRFLPRSIHKHRILGGPLRGYRIVTSWHDYPAPITGRTERPLLEWFAKNVKLGETWLDIGAHYGYTAIALSRLVGMQGRVFAFEPTPATLAQLVANVMLNGFNGVHLNQKAVSEKSGTSLLYLYKQNSLNSLARQDWMGQPLGQIAIETVTLDEYVSEQALPRVDLIKIDVEGAEILVLKGARQLLNGPNPPVVICEFSDKTTHGFGYDATELRQFLEDQGYKLYRWELGSRSLVPEPKRSNYITIYANLIGVKEKI